MSLFGEVIPDQCQLELKGNQEANLVTESSASGINESGKSRPLSGAFRISGNREWGIKANMEVAKEWEASVIQEANSDGRIGRSGALRFKMKSKSPICRVRKVGISENEMHRMRKEIPKEETFGKYGVLVRKLKSKRSEIMWGI